MKTTISPKLLALIFASSFLLGVCVQVAAPREDGDEATFTTIDPPGSTFTNSYDINPAGDIVGRYVSADGQTHGYLRSKNGEFTSIDFPGAFFTVAPGINGRGEIVGMYRFPNEPMMVRHGFLRSPDGRFTTNDFPGATFTSAKGINPRGDIVGEYCVNFLPCGFGLGHTHGYLRSKNGEFTSIDVPGAIETHAFKINPRGQIVGSYWGTDGKGHVFLLSDGEFTTIDFPGAFETPFHGEAQNGGINARGDIVSFYCDAAPCRADNGTDHGFLLSRGEFTSIDFPDATWIAAFGINPGGDIVGVYVDTGGNVHGFLLRRRERDEDGHENTE